MGYRRRRNNGAGGGVNQGGNDDGGVKGPSSALTSFLREQGINAEQIRLRYEQQQKKNDADNNDNDNNNNDNDNDKDKDKDDDVVEFEIDDLDGIQADEELNLDLGIDSDEEEIINSNSSKKQKTDASLNDSNIHCLNCDENFKISVYSKKTEKYGKIGYLCPSCTKFQIRSDRLSKKREIEAKKLKKKIAAALLDKKKFKLPSLQDFCIDIITDNINKINKLDNQIGTHNKNKICRILAKNRSLNNKTLNLFLDNSTKSLEFWDCSKIDKNSLDKIAAYCPNLTDLTLNMCGQLHNDNLNYFGSKLTNLKSLTLNGPFLINDDTWQSFFESKAGQNLTHFNLKNTHRFSNDSLVCLLENCGKNLKSLTLNRLDGLNSKPVYDLLPHFLSNLEYLELSSPHNENLIDDDLIINLLAINCETLNTLVLDKCSNLTNKFLIEGIKNFGSNLTKLSLCDLDQIDDEGMVELFDNWEINKGLKYISLERCIELSDNSIYQLLKHSNDTLIQLNLNSVKNITKKLFIDVSRNLKFPLLQSLDVGFVRTVDDSVLAILSRVCPALSILEVYGNNRCTHKALVRSDLTIIGRQSDSI